MGSPSGQHGRLRGPVIEKGMAQDQGRSAGQGASVPCWTRSSESPLQQACTHPLFHGSRCWGVGRWPPGPAPCTAAPCRSSSHIRPASPHFAPTQPILVPAMAEQADTAVTDLRGGLQGGVRRTGNFSAAWGQEAGSSRPLLLPRGWQCAADGTQEPLEGGSGITAGVHGHSVLC